MKRTSSAAYPHSVGRGEQEYDRAAARAGVMFFRYHGEEPPVVESDDDTARNVPPLEVRVRDYPTWGEEIAIPADLVILAIGAIPSKTNALVDMLKVPVDKDRFLREIHPKVRPEGSRSTFRS